MRLTTDFWVSALVRRVFGRGGFAAVERRGAAEAGAVHVVCRTRGGELLLFSPAPQASYDEGRPAERLFSLRTRGFDAERIAQALAKEARFDPDLWIVEVETEEEEACALLSVTTP